MSILNVDKIQPIGGGSTITVDATDIQASTGTIRASTFSGDISATGIGVTSLNVSGIATATGADINGDLDVDGHTNLDNVSVVGVSTFTRVGATAVFNSGAANDGRLEFQYNNSRVGLLAYHSDRLEIQTDSSKDFTIRTNGANERFRIKSNGYIGIGTDNPTEILDIISATNSQNLRIWSKGLSNNSTLFLRTGDSGGAFIKFGDNSDNDIGKIHYSNSTNSMQFTTNTEERLSINSTGLVTIKNFNGTGLQLQGSGGDYQGMQLQTTDSSASQTRNIFIDTLNELGNVIANQVGSVQSDGGSAWIWQTQPPGNRNDRRVERLRIDSNGYLSFAGDTDTYIWHPEANELAITVSGGSTPIIRFGTGGSNGTVGIKTDSALVTNGEALAVRGYSSFKSLNDGYAAIYTHNEEQGNSTIASHILFNVGGANRGGFGYDTDNSTLIMGNQTNISFKTGVTQLGGTEKLRINSDGKVGISSSIPREKLDVYGSINAGTENSPVFNIRNHQGTHTRAFKHYFDASKGQIAGSTSNRTILNITIDESFHQAGFEVTYFTRLQAVSDQHTRPNKIIFGVNRFNSASSVNVTKTVVEQHSEAASHCDVNVVSVSGTNYQIQMQFSTQPNVSSGAGGWIEGTTVLNARFADIDYYYGSRR